MNTRSVLAIALMAMIACTAPAPRCTEGASAACACPDGRTGAQICMASGAFGACVCQAVVDSGTETDAVSDGSTDASPDTGRRTAGVDLLLVIDNSNSMRENQANLMTQLEGLVTTLTSSMSGTGGPLNVGVVSTDLGTPGSAVPGCANSDSGDDAWLNPIRNGQALQRHLPWMSAPAGFRPADCTRADQFPSFISFTSGTTSAATFDHDIRCNAGLYVNGCGLEQQLESAWRALLWHHPEDVPGNTDMNAGFLRADSVLAIVVLSDEEDGSVRDCRYSRGEPCVDAIDVFNASSSRWSSANLNLRDYMYQPGSDQDPTWNLDRYINPRDPGAGFLALKPGHPEMVVFAAITGVPLVVPTTGSGTDQRIIWDRLLGTPDTANPNDFNRRNAGPGGLAIDEMSAEGPISMRQANSDMSCAERTVPACRREGTPYDPARPPCTTTDQYFAWPARRIVEVARRFDEARLCAGAPCNNGIVASICSNNYQAAVAAIGARIVARLPR